MEDDDFMIQLRRLMQTSDSDATFIFQIARQVISKSNTFSMNRQHGRHVVSARTELCGSYAANQLNAWKNMLILINPYDFD